MKDILVSNAHWLIIGYIAMGLFGMYEEKEVEHVELADSLPIVEAKLNKTKIKLAKIEKFKKDLEASRAKVKEIVKKIETVQKQLPSGINDTEVSTGLSKISKNLKMRDASTIPKIEKNKGFYFEKDFVFEATGTYLQFLIFYENLMKSERILNVKDFEIFTDAATEKSKSRFKIIKLKTTIESYRYNSNFKEKSKVNKI